MYQLKLNKYVSKLKQIGGECNPLPSDLNQNEPLSFATYNEIPPERRYTLLSYEANGTITEGNKEGWCTDIIELGRMLKARINSDHPFTRRKISIEQVQDILTKYNNWITTNQGHVDLDPSDGLFDINDSINELRSMRNGEARAQGIRAEEQAAIQAQLAELRAREAAEQAKFNALPVGRQEVIKHLRAQEKLTLENEANILDRKLRQLLEQQERIQEREEQEFIRQLQIPQRQRRLNERRRREEQEKRQKILDEEEEKAEIAKMEAEEKENKRIKAIKAQGRSLMPDDDILKNRKGNKGWW
jgi:hypothetical protein